MRAFNTNAIARRPVLFAVLTVLSFSAFAFQLWYHATRTSPTVDEPTHILAGHRHWQCRDFGINFEHPPFVKLLATLPLNFRTLAEPNWECGSRITKQADVFKAGAEFLIDNEIDGILVPARLLAAMLSLLLAALVFVAARKMFGPWEAVTALVILSFEPNLIAHGSLVTTDMALALTSLASACALYFYARIPSWKSILLIGSAFGLMLASKHSAAIFFPVLFVIFVADGIFYRVAGLSLPREITRRVAVFAASLLIGVATLWAFYGFQYYALPDASRPSVDLREYIAANSLPDVARSFQAKGVLLIERLGVLPESYALGLADVIASGSRSTSIFGRTYQTGRWIYFPLAFLVKTSIVLLVLMPFGVLLAFVAAPRRREMLYLLAPPAFFFAFSLTSKINIGVRHILPVYGFFIIVAAAGAVWMSRRFAYFRYALATLLLFHSVAAFRTAPNYIGFSNELWGGTDNTYKVFPGDSNLDWGQNEKQVSEYLARENITDCWYAGWGNLELLNAMVPCRQMPNTFPRLEIPLADPVPPVIDGTVLVSVANLPPRGGNEYVPMTLHKPVAQISGSIFVYRGRFEIKLAAAISHAQRADRLVGLNRLDEAIADGRRAVELADYDPRPHLALGLAFLKAGNNSEASLEFGAVLETARANLSLFRNVDARARLELQRMAIK